MALRWLMSGAEKRAREYGGTVEFLWCPGFKIFRFLGTRHQPASGRGLINSAGGVGRSR